MTKKSWIILIIEALVFIALLGTISRCSRDKIDTLEHNIDAYKDRIEYVEDRNENLLVIKSSLILSEEEARKMADAGCIATIKIEWEEYL